VTPRITVEDAVRAVNTVLADIAPDCPPAEADTPLRTLPMESIEFSEVLAELEDVVGGEIDPDSLVLAETVADLTRVRPVVAAPAVQGTLP
jgi:acyl carrier protein